MTEKQKDRYNRHIILSEVGEEGQEKLLKAKVLVVGAGGLGAPVLQYLVAIGIGTIGIIDADEVSLSNLQRQILYKEDEIGQSKVFKAQKTLNKLNSDVKINTYQAYLDNTNAEELISQYDMVIGATDNFSSRKCIDKFTKKLNKPFVHGAIGEFEGQVAVFNYKGSPSYSDLFNDTPDESTLPLGVLGVLPGIIGSMMACEAIKIIIGKGQILAGSLFVYNALSTEINIFKI